MNGDVVVGGEVGVLRRGRVGSVRVVEGLGRVVTVGRVVGVVGAVLGKGT